MEDNNLDQQKIASEMDKAHPTPRMEDSKPIALDATDPFKRSDMEKKIVDTLVSEFRKYEAARRSREAIWEQIYRLYLTVVEKTKTPTRSKITVPIVFQLIEAAVPKIMNTLFASGETFFDVIRRDIENGADEVQEPKIKKLLDVQLQKADFFSKFLDFTKQLMLYGTSYMKVYWKVQRDWVWERVPTRTPNSVLGVPLPDSIEWSETKTYRVTERRPEVEVLDILDVFPDPDASNPQEGRGVFIRSWIDKDSLVEMGQGKYPIYENVNSPDLTATSNTKAEARSEREAARGVNTQDSNRKDQIELLEFWGKYDIDGDGIKEECQIVIANRQVLLKAKGNPFHHQKRPIVKTALFPIPKEWYGIGLIEPVISEIHELNTLRRQRIDNINLVINRMWKINSFADIDMDTLISAPDNVVITDDMQAVDSIETKDVTSNAYNEATSVQTDIERATVPASAQGVPSGGQLGRTARGAQLIIGQALEKFGTATKLIEETSLKPLLELFYKLNLQFIDDDQVLTDPILYGEIADLGITPEDLRAQTKFKLIGISEMVGSEASINQLISYEGVFGKVLAPETNLQIAKKVYRLMKFNPDEINFQGAPLQPGVENVVDPNISAAIVGQAGTQGTQAAPNTIPGVRPS